MDLAARLDLALVHTKPRIKQQDLADRLGVPKAWMSSVKKGRWKGDEKLREAAAILGVPPDWLISGEGPAPAWFAETKPPPAPIVVEAGGDPGELKVLATAAAGDGQSFGVSFDHPEGYRWKPSRVLVRIAGNSAYPVAFDGQFVVCDPTRPLRHNNLVLVMLDDDRSLVKRWCVNPDAPGGGVYASVNAGLDSPWIEPATVRARWPIVGVLFE
jgi:transcriptional regulator with XRE-family HTH domain